jgi:anaerobic glycerol-3-phosphate dehydrogenase C subunit
MSRAMYSSGACLYRVRPLGIVWPKHKHDVIAVVKFAAQKALPITARGGGTSRTGNELGEGIILDFSKYMNKILTSDPKGKWVRVQPGLVLSSLNTALEPHGVFFPIDPSTKDYCTLGGMIANNSSGPHAVRYGTTRNYILSLEVVLSNGEILTTGPVASNGIATGAQEDDSGTLEGRIYRAMPEILERYQGPMRDERPFTTKDSSGYSLWGIQNDGSLDLTSLFVGSEGTLGIVTEAKLELVPIPGRALSGLVYFEDLGCVGDATRSILALSPSMLEIMERQILDLAREQREEMRPYLPEGIEALLFVEFQGDDDAGLRKKFEEVENRIVRDAKLAVDLRVAESPDDMQMFAKVRSVSGPILNKIKGPVKPAAFIEDAAVHPSRLSQYIKGLRERFETHGVDASIYGHAGDGNLHTMVFLNLNQEDQVRKMVSLAESVYDLVLDLQGTISGEHGDGRTRTYYLRRQYPRLFPAFVEIKDLFDPQHVLNPGCIVGGEGNPLEQHLKYGMDYHVVPTESVYDDETLKEEIETCSGCGKCRSYCPIAQGVPEEWAMGRGKATLLREILSGHLDAKTLQSPELKKVMDSCINCKRCLKECPSGVDIPWLALKGRANFLQEHGEPLADRLLTDTRFLCETGSALTPLVNLANSLAPLRVCLEKTVGLDRRRNLPPFHRRTLRRLARERGHPPGDRKVVLFLSCYSNFNEPEGDGLATLEVLEHNRFQVLIPDFRCCGIARINSGAIDKVMEDIEINVEKMGSFVEQGLDIVFSEPSCALAVKMDYPKILNTDTTAKVAERCYDIHQYLMMLHKRGELNLELGEMNLTLGYHNPCHLRALGVSREPVELLRQIPGVKVHVYSDGCCGLGGTFGMKKDNFDLSMEIGSRLFEEIRSSQVDEVVTTCGACKMQILQGTRRDAIHPISLLAMAYKKGARHRSLESQNSASQPTGSAS